MPVLFREFDATEDAELAEYRLDELAQLTGVSSRNIRAYQGRGLLPPPHREGRVAVYDENHLFQLRMIAELLEKGYALTHIQTFLEGLANRHDLVDILGLQELVDSTGLQQAVTAPWYSVPAAAKAVPETPQPLLVDPASQLARELVAYGIAREADGGLVIVDPEIAAIVAAAKDQHFYLRVLVAVRKTTVDTVEQLAKEIVDELSGKLIEHYGEGWIAPADQHSEVAASIADVRELGALAVNKALADALTDHSVHAVTQYLEKMMATSHGLTGEELISAIRPTDEEPAP
ncbi:MerR family transcriptional regulator [[Mycobacterium] holstebronense]|uniref:MerR family transcriptional regulator n=1 Tax=[Mycobacterium] holstebronense TaxID=3064288 RepID=A0ABM9M6I5_9MYCO|nr:MerR family transcriptional regulator [Mycolicibacter sp. MU0102]CAJ1510801.1 MerR family transcriptional regulator [Mycolicibacter sp. MU0102]